MKKFIEFFGWYGTVAILLTYSLAIFSVLSPTNIWYQILNVTGGIGLATLSIHKKAYQVAVVNILWAIVGLVAIFRLILIH